MGTSLLTNETGKSIEIIGNTSVSNFIEPKKNEVLIVKGMLIHGEGNIGETSIVTNTGRVLLRLYHSNQSNLSPSGRTHIVLNEDETIGYTVTGRDTKKTFIGVSVERYQVR